MTVSSTYEEERKHLQTIIEKIEKQQNKLKKIPRYYGKELVEQLLDDQRQKQLQQLRIAHPEPYFGRLDFQANGAKSPAPLYIGKVGIQDEDTDQLLVIDWRAPIASIFYSFTGQTDQATYDSPDGVVEGIVHLKRNIAIRNQIIQRVVDGYVRGGDNLGVTDEFLLYRLGENKDHRLRDIVSTIQVEQDQIIRTERNIALVIQGVPGSGKTTVALHRLAYLMYQYQDHIQAEKIVIFAPNNMFLDYISDVLPELGVGGVQQTTFAEWVLGILEEEITLPDPAKRLSRWFDVHEENNEEPARFKGSIQFQKLLHLALDQYEATFVPAKNFTAWEGKELSKDTIHDWFYKEYQHYPVMKRRERVFARIKRWIETEHKQARVMDPKGVLKKQATRRLNAYMKTWPKHTPLELYAQFLSSLLTFATDSSSLPDDMPALVNKIKKKEVEIEDLAPLLYIHNRLYGIDPQQQFHHVVIDEAQDFSPFQIAVLKQHCPSQSFTILGDLLQNIFSFQGIDRWDKFLNLFDQSQTSYVQLDRSYRSTMEIIRFANQIISKYNQEITPAKPVFRSGEPVRVIQAEKNDHFRAVSKQIKRYQDGGANTIAIITRNEPSAQKAYQALASMGLELNLITSEQTEYRGGLSVVPIYLSKGMEFDAVLLLDVDDKHYSDQAFDAKLLYVGCTRALHQLSLFYVEKQSPLITEIPQDLYSKEKYM